MSQRDDIDPGNCIHYSVNAWCEYIHQQFKWLHFKKGRRQVSHLEIFDRASRGVWGSILLVTTMPFNITTIGAYITILRLSFSSFTQQVVHIKQNEVIRPSNRATFGYSHNYTRGIDSQLTVSYEGKHVSPVIFHD